MTHDADQGKNLLHLYHLLDKLDPNTNPHHPDCVGCKEATRYADSVRYREAAAPPAPPRCACSGRTTALHIMEFGHEITCPLNSEYKASGQAAPPLTPEHLARALYERDSALTPWIKMLSWEETAEHYRETRREAANDLWERAVKLAAAERPADDPLPLEAQLKHLGEMKDEDIDLSDVPEVTDFSKAEVGKFYRPQVGVDSGVEQVARKKVLEQFSDRFENFDPHRPTNALFVQCAVQAAMATVAAHTADLRRQLEQVIRHPHHADKCVAAELLLKAARKLAEERSIKEAEKKILLVEIARRVEAEHKLAERKAETPCRVSLGVGEAGANLYVHGDYESIKLCQDKLLRAEAAEHALAQAQKDAIQLESYLSEDGYDRHSAVMETMCALAKKLDKPSQP